MKENIIASGAEALIIKRGEGISKRRVKKRYRIDEIDNKLRIRRTRAEGKIMEKAGKIIFCPKVINVDDKKHEIEMEFLEGKKLSDYLDSFKINGAEKICIDIGISVAKLHDNNIIHGDLTTSNIILKEKKVYFIDFGLAFQSNKIEDRAVDIHLFKQALESKHFRNFYNYFKNFIIGYSKENKDSEKVLKQLEKVEKRGRYKH
jgi:Kae1-associated kinase Bud32